MNAFLIHFLPVIFRSIEAAKKKEKRKICKCDISGKNSKSNTSHKVKSYTFKKCKDAKKVCPKKCWRDGKKALKKKSMRDKMCRKYYKKCRKCKSKEIIKMYGHAKVEKCGYNKRYSYKMKLCCKKKKKKITGILCWSWRWDRRWKQKKFFWNLYDNLNIDNSAFLITNEFQDNWDGGIWHSRGGGYDLRERERNDYRKVPCVF